MKFTRNDTPTIMDGKVVRYKCGDFEINARRNGVSTNGFMPIIKRQEDLEVVIEYLKRAFRQYVQLSPNSSSLYGRAEPFPEAVFEATQHGVEPTVESAGTSPAVVNQSESESPV